MSTATVGLLSALIGALSGLAGARLTARANSRDERERHRLELVAERDREARVAVGELAAILAKAIQTVDWFVWQAARRPAGFSSATIDEYDADVKAQFPALMEAAARVAALSPDAFARFGSFSKEVFDLDREVSDGASAFPSEPAAALARIATFEDRADHLFWQLQEELARWAAEARSGLERPEAAARS